MPKLGSKKPLFAIPGQGMTCQGFILLSGTQDYFRGGTIYQLFQARGL
jgi:hypothetical protein